MAIRKYWKYFYVIYLILFLTLFLECNGEYLQEFEISEGVGIGTTIGFIGQKIYRKPKPPQPPYLIVPVPGSAVDSDLHIDQSTGEIRTSIVLDREMRSYYSFVAIPLSGENIRVTIKVIDENDNAPEFPTPMMTIAFPENTPRDVKRTLNPAKDRDLGIFNTQRYEIISGNINNAFRLSSHREKDDVLYLDLQINGFLDRETTPFYSLVIEAFDGGIPPTKGTMRVNITIQDVNDNQPIFNQSRYFATVAENATIGTSVLRVFATDTDTEENGNISYSINRRQSDREKYFMIDSKTGVIFVNKPLDFESHDVHELVVVAQDNGAQPLETTAFVSIRVTDVNDNQPTINLIFLSDDASPKISESASPGEYVARISVNDPDSKEEYANTNVTLNGGNGHFGLTTQDNIVYLVVVSRPLDREVKPTYTMTVKATDQGNPPLNTSRSFELAVTDTNDNAPEFDRTLYYADVLEVADPGTSVFHLSAVDRDEGNNSDIIYSIQDTPQTDSKWFQIDNKTGLITTRRQIDCETNPTPQVVVVASDGGSPPLSSSATVIVRIGDVSDNEPIFDQSFYNITIKEDEQVGKCVLKVSATDPDCGVNAMVNYTLGSGTEPLVYKDFIIHADRGDLCINRTLDHEKQSFYEISVLATDRGGLSTTAMIKVQVIDVNDNRPIFYPREYNVSLREQTSVSSSVVVVVASDSDSGIYGRVTYSIVDGNDSGFFKIDENTGEIFVIGRLDTTKSLYHVEITAKDGTGLTSEKNAHVYFSVLTHSQQPPTFKQARYSFSIAENAVPRTLVGAVVATGSNRENNDVRYSIYSGDPDEYFSINSTTGAIHTRRTLDHETHSILLLNVQVASGQPPSYDHSQVNITIKDVNDNAPQFKSTSFKISVPENTVLNSPIYVAQANDPDSDANGEIHYNILQTSKDLFSIDNNIGTISLRKSLDYEIQRQYILILRAEDSGVPSLSSTMTLTVEVQDVNDNVPEFEKPSYQVNILESLPINSQFLQVTATDRDTGNNARLSYKLTGGDQDKFGIFPNNGYLYLKDTLDREVINSYTLSVLGMDNGDPPQSASATVLIRVLDANDNTPQFTKKKFLFTVEENTKKGRLVGTVAAYDKDLGNNASLRYSLLSSNSSFQINPITGEIFTKLTLDRETMSTYELIAEVRDQGSPIRLNRATVTIEVLDKNDNKPVFVEPTDKVVTVREEQPVGTEVAQIQATDADEGENASITYVVIPGTEKNDGSSLFAIHQKRGVITTKVILDHEEQNEYVLTIVARDNGIPTLEAQLQLLIKVVDLNDNRPTFPTSTLTFRISENLPIGEEVGLVQAVDQDGGENGRVTYSIISGNLYGIFDISKTTGALFTVGEVDYEMSSEYTLQVKALDSSTINPRSSVMSVKVYITDINDCIPKFKTDPIIFSVPESIEEGTLIWNFSALDEDSGVNGQLKYAISHQSPMSIFKVDSNTGALTLTKKLDYESFPEFTIIITATDQAKEIEKRLSTSATCKVIVEDENDNSPIFQTRNRVDVEDEPIGFPILHIVATDADSRDNGRVTYVISSGNENGNFAVDYETGLLSIAKSLDREHRHFYELNITAFDHGKPARSTSQVINIHVEDINDNPPQFRQHIYKARVSEGSPIGTSVIKVEAFDKDLGHNGNLTYIIPKGIADDKFTINGQSGRIATAGLLDREERSYYLLTVYVKDGAFPTFFDSATVEVEILDVNDHAPNFGQSCYSLQIPENSDFSIIHTVVATDLDYGQNSEVTYTIKDGNINNKFTLDLHTGELSSHPLDREEISQYHLVIAARDNGKQSLTGFCNISVTVLDQNDNDPMFKKNEYHASVPEDAFLNTTVVIVQASDQDEGRNNNITYSLSNETLSLFKVDSATGVITTTGYFDREKKSSYMFEVRATDGGQYDARSERTLVHVTVLDVNDNKPKFINYPFVASVSAHAHPGTQVIQLEAQDLDQGSNAKIHYSFVSQDVNSKFHLDSKSGVVTVADSLLPDAGKMFHIEIAAKDNGHPSLTASGVLEIIVGNRGLVASLKFQNETYMVELPENPPRGLEVTSVKAVALGHHSSIIKYSFPSEYQEGAFTIDSRTGLIKVHDPKQLDFETTSQQNIIIVARTDDLLPMYAYASLVVQLVDLNDNPPRFSQDRYVSSVWEGNHKGTYVTQVSATDEDKRGRGNVVYHILDGNHDNAFVVDPPFSGIVKTNIVLDREIRDNYFLTIIATDEGIPQLTGTCLLKITIVDVNDNQPVFPPYNVVSISEGAVVGTVLTTITANDVDTNPALIYSFSERGNPGGVFTIDRFSGRITLAQPLDYEKQNQYQLQLQVSDSVHLAKTYLTVHVTDINDNAPVFAQQSYQVQLPEFVEPGYFVIKVNATDLDSVDNARLTYSIGLTPVEGFYINRDTGVIYTNKSFVFSPKQPIIYLVVTAQDSGVPPLAAATAVRIQIVNINDNIPKFSQPIYTAHIPEDSPLGTTVLKVSATDPDEFHDNYQIFYSIISGNTGGSFSISSNTGEILLVKQLDREVIKSFSLEVSATDHGMPTLNATAEVIIQVNDINDNPPMFNQSHYEVFISELAPIGTTVLQVLASDRDETTDIHVIYDITSGNTEKKFKLNSKNGIITLVETLDYDLVTEYRFIVRASDGDPKYPLSALASVTVKVNDENDNEPYFPLTLYTEFVDENSPVGTSIFVAHANDGDRGIYGQLNYSITDGEERDKFSIDIETGVVTTGIIFDYESKSRYYFTIMAMDKGGKYTTVHVQINIQSKDEYPPEFTHNSYHFIVPGNAPNGFVVGMVRAVDRDDGIDGRIFYSLSELHKNFKLNDTTGVIVIKSPFRYEQTDNRIDQNIFNKVSSLTVVAGSGRPHSLTSSAVVQITVDYTLNASSVASAEEKVEGSSLPSWALGLVIVLAVIAVVLLSLILFLRMRNKRNGKPGVIHGFDNSFDTINIRPPPSSTSGISQFPPHYSDISHFDPTNHAQHINGATSEVSEQSHSASSGRGSVEDGEDVEDEEIRMINEGSHLQQNKIHRLTIPDSGILPDDDNLSEISIQNTQEYLARLGINTSHPDHRNIQNFNKLQNAHSVESMHMFDEEGGGEGNSMDIGNLIYSKLNDVGTEENNAIMDGTRAFGFGDEGEPSMTGSLSSIVHSEEELTGSYNWDYLLDWGPQYQPLAHVFAEIARLKDDGISPSFSNSPKKTLNPQVKTVPPPLITSVAPCSIAPVALASGHTSQTTSLPSLPRSPISHESTFSSSAMSPSFSPSLSPLATRSPSYSPLVHPGGTVAPISGLVTPHYSRSQRSNPTTTTSSVSETELQI
ncbi:LOW QUALITY PROTEIN: protein dachsous-like [Tachypleus tridentatus]|uniref:LOW QUALITY PROTEIN: protein dachsous-like n=1 Tax=Tachypleus tridentatus TaxID=6853 RepID=UPI003FCFFF12